MSLNKILFLDFDGVLHPEEVYLTKKGPELRADGHLFMWAPRLSEVLADFPQVKVVLSTSWARRLGFQRAKRYLPPDIQARVIGATWHSHMGNRLGATWWDTASRYEQICRFAARSNLLHWLAVDDDSLGWPVEMRGKLVLCPGSAGLSDEHCIELLKASLAELCSTP